MRIILLTILYVSLSILVGAQSKTFNVAIKNQPLIKVLKEVEKKYSLFFSYKVKDVKNVVVNLNINTNSVKNLLHQLLATTTLHFEIVDGNFVVIKQKTNNINASKTKTICGTVYDYQNKKPLPYANVIVENTSNGTTTDEDGNFELNYQLTANEKLKVSYVGYETQSIAAAKFTNKNCPTILLQMPAIEEAFLVIKDYLTDGVNVESNGASTNIKPLLMGNMPGIIEPDVLSILQFLPGVAAPSSKASDIYIRGCTPDQNLIIWEDIPIYHTAHYFGMVSSINPFIIKNANIYRGGFNATYGGRIGGVIELLSPDEKAYKNNFGLGANMTHAQAYAHKKMKFGNKPAAVTFSLRRSYNEIFESPTFKTYTSISQQGLLFKVAELDSLKKEQIDIKNDFYFLDANFKFSTQINSRNKVQLSGMHVANNFNDEIKESRRRSFNQTDSLYLINRGLSLKWQHQWNNNAATVVKAIVANDSLNYKYKVIAAEGEKPIIDAHRKNSVTDRQLVLHNNFDGSKGQNWQIGYQFTNYKVNYSISEEERREFLEENLLGNVDLHALYAHFQNPIENKIGVQAGIRLSQSSIDKKFSKNKVKFEPRIRVDCKLSKSISVHSSFGLYHQVLGQVAVFKGSKLGFELPIWELANKESEVQKSEMYQVGLMYKANDWVVDVQAYKRKVDGISSRAYSIETIPQNRPEAGNSNIVGIDVLLKKRIGKFRSWLSYSLSKADLTFEINEQKTTFRSNYDQRHILDYTNQLRLNNWQFSAGFKISSGLPYTEMVGFEYLNSTSVEIPPEQKEPKPYIRIYGPINGNVLPINTTLNLSANYQLKPLNKKWNAHFTTSIVNLLNAKNFYERTYIVSDENGKDEIKAIDKTSLPFTPNVSIRFVW